MSRALPSLIILGFLTFASVTSHAEESSFDFDVLEQCELSGELSLKKPTQVYCNDTLRVADGTHIRTNGFTLQIVSVNELVLGEAKGLTIEAFDQDAKIDADKNAGDISLLFGTLSGRLTVDNRGLGATAFAGFVDLTGAALTSNFTQEIRAGYGAEVHVVVSQVELKLDGDLHKIIR